jgi:uncharacterized protein YkwD
MHFLFLLLLFCTGVVSAPAQESLRFQTVDQLRFRGIMKQTTTDTVMKVERLAALKFHQLINAYRLENKLDTLRFNDTLWHAARNHNIWMIANNELSHVEEKETPSFTGEDPGDRYAYVVNDHVNCSWTGENCLYNHAYISTINESIERIANAAIAQWKASPGHNANMLRERHWQHGVAFSISKDGRCWATDLFTGEPSFTTYFSSNTVTETSSTQAAEKRKKFVQAQAETELRDRLYSVAGESLADELLQKTAQLHVDYLSVNRKSLGHTQTEGKRNFMGSTPEKRFAKAAGFKAKKLLKKYTLKESVASASYHVDDFDAALAADELLLLLNSEQKGSGTGKLVGFGLSMKRSKNVVTVYVVRVELMEKGG